MVFQHGLTEGHLVCTKMSSFQLLTFLQEAHKNGEVGVTYPQSHLVVLVEV